MVIYVLWISMVHHFSSAPWLPPYRPSATHLPGSWQLQLAKWEALSGPHATNNDLVASDSNVWTSVGRVVLWRCGMHMIPKCPWNQHPLLVVRFIIKKGTKDFQKIQRPFRESSPSENPRRSGEVASWNRKKKVLQDSTNATPALVSPSELKVEKKYDCN